MRANAKTVDPVDQETTLESDQSKIRADWVTRIINANSNTVAAIIELGQNLIETKAVLKHGQWQLMFEKNELPFSLSFAERYMKIASDKKLKKSASLQNLPAAVSTLYELSRLSDDEFGQAEAAGIINSEMTHKNATALVKSPQNKIQQSSKNKKPVLRPRDVIFGEIEEKIDELDKVMQKGTIQVDVEFKKGLLRASDNLRALAVREQSQSVH
jgi:Protein of unknown function (DUF3102)